MIKHFFSHYWKSVIRNAMWRRNLATKIVFGILVLYLLMAFVYIGIFLPQILGKFDGNPVAKFNSVLLWYFLFDLLVRTMMQSLPVIQVIPYLRFKFRKSTVIHYLFIRSLWNIFNFLPWLIVIPFCVSIVPAGTGCVSYVIGIALIIAINNFLALYFQYISQKNFIFSLIPLVMVAVSLLLQRTGNVIADVSTMFGNAILTGNFIVLASLVVALIFIYYINRKLLSNGFYLDEVKTKKKSDDRFARFPGMGLFDRWGLTGKYMALELNLLFRNKRPRQGLVMLPIFWVYFVYIMIRDGSKLTTGVMGVYFISILVGMSAIVYGQFLFSWESSFFDGIIARRIDFKRYVYSKYYIMSMLVLIGSIPIFCLMVPIVHVNPLLIIALTLFVLGPIQFIIFFLGCLNDARIDLSMGQFFNYQGVKGKNFLVAFAFFLIPTLLYALLNYLFGNITALLSISFTGIVFIVFHKYWLENIIIRKFLDRKYKNLEGYRKLIA
jgi:hypothetical protein